MLAFTVTVPFCVLYLPIINVEAPPRPPARAAMAVAVALSLRGNHTSDTAGGIAPVTLIPSPLNNWPNPIKLQVNIVLALLTVLTLKGLIKIVTDDI